MASDTHNHDDLYHRGLNFDVGTLLRRRRMLGMFAGAGLALTVAGCGTAEEAVTGSAATTAAATGAAGQEIPEETAGPYPGDGSNGPNVLNQTGIVRQDIRSSFGTASGLAKGVPLTIDLTIRNLAGGAYAGAAVYLWHCDIDGRYSLYSQGVTNQNYLRGVQEADASGKVTFTSIFPAAYSGRWPHIHFEVYPALAKATSPANKISTSQLALPEKVCSTVYATSGYEQSVRNLAGTSLSNDNVFSDGWAQQLATVTGDVSAGYVASLVVPVG
ncbi:3,4-dioxygenase subunit beta [Dactylosporangium sp. NBC_01737]|uniref:dioxygenase family protein n=1 Tax=Dactylosporangium sp. NBC_01737 TaxID=2975959 RepID=UPI002E11829B|nr:3,4-dioxygenase subunit beta [Dactylosporangium sp. NBC_01737]